MPIISRWIFYAFSAVIGISVVSVFVVKFAFTAPAIIPPAPLAPIPHTVSWFLENPADLASTYGVCKNNPGTYANTSECVNAEAAATQQAGTDSFAPMKNTGPNVVNPFSDVTNAGTKKP